MARQPILDRESNVAGYELLYRSSSQAQNAEGDAYTRTIRSLEALVELGIEFLADDRLAFVNIDFDYLNGSLLDVLPADRIVLEILESTQPTPKNLEITRSLAARGFRLALDDFAFQEHLEPFLDHVGIVKLECPALDPAADGRRIRRLIASGKTLLAEKVEEVSDFKRFYNLGCHLFQGYYFAKPSLVEGETQASNKMALMTLLAKVHDENVSLREIETIVASDVTFTYKLMKLVHAAVLGAPPTVQTVGQAIQFLGLRSTAAVASLLALSAIPGRPNELLVLALARAKMCEELARQADLPEPDSYFTVGLLSVLDAFLDRPLQDIVNDLPLSPALANALTGADTDEPRCRALDFTKKYERGEFLRIEDGTFNTAQAQRAYDAAIRWADTTCETLKAA
jgi:EAL and modified HD-GYP domain-containing signal transduction protein